MTLTLTVNNYKKDNLHQYEHVLCLYVIQRGILFVNQSDSVHQTERRKYYRSIGFINSTVKKKEFDK